MKRQFSRKSLLWVAIPVVALLMPCVASVGFPEYRYPTKTTVSSSPNPSQIGQSVTITATVTLYDHAVPDGGTVNFYARRNWTGSGVTANGVASITTTFYTKGHWSVEAKYAGVQVWRPSHGFTEQLVCAAGRNCL